MSIADQIIKKCGGVPKTAAIVGKSENWVYKWRISKEKGGTGGLVPRDAQEKLLAAAARKEVNIRPSDFFESAR